jgi:hypothetical protein
MTAPDKPDELLEELRRLADEVDPVPPEVNAYARAALGWRRIDSELAELLSDSALDPQWATLARSGVAQARSVTFRAEDLEIDLEIHDDASGLVLLGQLAPPVPASLEVQRDDASIPATAQADKLGRFRIALTEGGRIRLRVLREAPAGQVETSWIGI